jgi:hypothetical protein
MELVARAHAPCAGPRRRAGAAAGHGLHRERGAARPARLRQRLRPGDGLHAGVPRRAAAPRGGADGRASGAVDALVAPAARACADSVARAAPGAAARVGPNGRRAVGGYRSVGGCVDRIVWLARSLAGLCLDKRLWARSAAGSNAAAARTRGGRAEAVRQQRGATTAALPPLFSHTDTRCAVAGRGVSAECGRARRLAGRAGRDGGARNARRTASSSHGT